MSKYLSTTQVHLLTENLTPEQFKNFISEFNDEVEADTFCETGYKRACIWIELLKKHPYFGETYTSDYGKNKYLRISTLKRSVLSSRSGDTWDYEVLFGGITITDNDYCYIDIRRGKLYGFNNYEFIDIDTITDANQVLNNLAIQHQTLSISSIPKKIIRDNQKEIEYVPILKEFHETYDYKSMPTDYDIDKDLRQQ